jgi:hypothetical protein
MQTARLEKIPPEDGFRARIATTALLTPRVCARVQAGQKHGMNDDISLFALLTFSTGVCPRRIAYAQA